MNMKSTNIKLDLLSYDGKLGYDKCFTPLIPLCPYNSPETRGVLSLLYEVQWNWEMNTLLVLSLSIYRKTRFFH